jgi:ubiquinone/menaquinone biosynthesis C-methylase UbiE
MDHQDHVRLIRNGITSPGGIWAEFGSGRGAFTLALAELLGSESAIYSVDKNKSALREQARAIERKIPHNQPVMHYLHKDYRRPLAIPSLNGLLMANSLHYDQDKAAVLHVIHEYLLPGGRFILVEYNSDQGNRWVPYPISFSSWGSIANEAGFERTRLMEKVPSTFMGEIFSAISYKIEDINK